jgi:hypothetical protein
MLVDGQTVVRLRCPYDAPDYLNNTNREFLSGEILIGKQWVRGAVSIVSIQTVYEAV